MLISTKLHEFEFEDVSAKGFGSTHVSQFSSPVNCLLALYNVLSFSFELILIGPYVNELSHRFRAAARMLICYANIFIKLL